MEVKDQHTILVQDRAELPPLLERHADFTVWILYKVKKFPKDLRFSFGEYLSRNCFLIMDGLVESYYLPRGIDRTKKLQEVSANIEKLRLHLRMAWKLKLINASALHYSTECLQQEGKMLGGWLRMEQENNKK
jgi:23S rRNA-intervening sequence protein